ncbi:aldo-keto reductase [Tieghemostelium lacteum]|uniref:Aldo-keto reductase n=1 Tax=Tieghemostelium lacteum TaxID=361077 RepID=A0A151ZFP8_TIELA|nr:aldo-keto reductase [Tieghemostelium lacteum]|eukprot:KYQ92801.1 aldo-keto reductase [Tieghemostelium lacteum]
MFFKTLQRMSQITINSTVTLNNGVKMPLFGFGTYQLSIADMDTSIKQAVESGYVHFDTASIYRNEEALGKVLKELFESGKLKREDIFVTSKVSTAEQGFDKAYEACLNSLKRLQLDYLDLYLIHWPGVQQTALTSPINSKLRAGSWEALEKLQSEKKCRSIGVSNYTIKHLDELLSTSKTVPAVNQVEFHPFLYQTDLLEFCNKKGIQLEAYSSLVRGEANQNKQLEEIGIRHNKTISQVLLKWAIQKGIPVIPKSKTPSRIKENADIFDFNLTDEEMKKIDDLNCNKRICWNPETVV